SCVFFFSSRRRHTRSKRDWSSDVCSSDLLEILGGGVQEHRLVQRRGRLGMQDPEEVPAPVGRPDQGVVVDVPGLIGRRGGIEERSEERRVGKEGRGGGARQQAERRDGNRG